MVADHHAEAGALARCAVVGKDHVAGSQIGLRKLAHGLARRARQGDKAVARVGNLEYQVCGRIVGIVPGDTETLTLVVIAFIVSALVYWAATYVQTYLVGWVGQRVLQDLRLQLFAHLQTLSVGFYSRRQAGVIISRLTNDVQALDQLVSDGVVTLFGSTLTLVGTAVILIVLDLELALLTFLVFPLLALGLATS